MEEKVKEIIGNSLEHLNLTVDSVVYEKENNHSRFISFVYSS